MEKVVWTNEEWRARLTREQCRVTRKGHTERAFSGRTTTINSAALEFSGEP